MRSNQQNIPARQLNAVGTWLASAQPLLCALTLACALPALATDEHFATLRVGRETYADVTVTSVTATDLYFKHSQGLGNAKLKNLDLELQKHFGFNPAQAAVKERQQIQGQAVYREALRAAPPPKAAPEPDPFPQKASEGAPGQIELFAKSFLNKPAPTIVAKKWLTPQPDTRGKFVLIDFWATWCGPCRRSIPLLNALQQKYKDRLVVIGLSSETEEEVRKMTEPRIDYAVAVDPLRRAADTVGVERIPHVLLVDPQGIVRFEGNPAYLEQINLGALMGRYGS